MSAQKNAVIEVDLLRQSIDGHQYLILESSQQLRAVIHRLVLIPVTETESAAGQGREFSGNAADILLLDKQVSENFRLNVSPDIDLGYLALGLVPDRYMTGVAIQQHVPANADNKLHTDDAEVLQDNADRTLVMQWLQDRSDWLQTYRPVLYV